MAKFKTDRDPFSPKCSICGRVRINLGNGFVCEVDDQVLNCVQPDHDQEALGIRAVSPHHHRLPRLMDAGGETARG